MAMKATSKRVTSGLLFMFNARHVFSIIVAKTLANPLGMLLSEGVTPFVFISIFNYPIFKQRMDSVP